MVPHLLQDTSIADPTRARLTEPALVRFANRVHRRGQAQVTQLLEWLAERGLAPHGHSHQRGDTLRRSDLERLFLGVSYRARAHFVASTPAASW